MKESTVYYSTVSRKFEKLSSNCKNLKGEAKSEIPKSMDSEGVLQAIETNLTNNTQRESDEHGILQGGS